MPSIRPPSAAALPAPSHDRVPGTGGHSARSARNGGARHGGLLAGGTPGPHIPGSGGTLPAQAGRAGGRARADSHHVTRLSPRATCGRQRSLHGGFGALLQAGARRGRAARSPRPPPLAAASAARLPHPARCRSPSRLRTKSALCAQRGLINITRGETDICKTIGRL